MPPPEAVTAPETELRNRLLGVFAEALPDVDWRDDKLHDSLGQEGPVGAVYPEQSGEQPNQGLVQDTVVVVQLFHQWTREVNAEQTVSPADIEESAERLRRAVRKDELGAPGDAHLWYYRILRIEFVADPTGNITRLRATVQASSQNAGLTETTG